MGIYLNPGNEVFQMALDSNIYIDMNFDGLKEAIISIIGGIPQRINSRRFQNNMTDFDSKDDVMTLLVHLGYPGYDTDQTFILSYNDENSLSCVISLAYYSARKDYNIIREMPTGKGFADIIFIPGRQRDLPALLVELKYDKAAEGAIKQIKDKMETQRYDKICG